jgi:hypothetical protein
MSWLSATSREPPLQNVTEPLAIGIKHEFRLLIQGFPTAVHERLAVRGHEQVHPSLS